MLDRALDLVGAHCDLESRVRDIPPAARLRGIWVRTFEQALERRGSLGAYLEVFGSRASALTWYPAGDVLARFAVAGALYATPQEVHTGIRSIARDQAVLFSESLLGRTMLRLLSRDPVRALQQGAAARRQTCNYGRWEFDFSQPRCAIAHHIEEYIWIESQVLGSAEGTFLSIGVDARFELEMQDRFNGVIKITW